jgi:alpha-beta hydrolase superfamily lysophospholipase
VTHYESRGYKVLTPAYPGFDLEVEALRADSSPIEAVTTPKIMERMQEVVGSIETPPILMGHSMGGAIVQLLLDRGYGSVGVGIDSAPPEGILVNPPSQLKSLAPALVHPSTRHKLVPFTFEQFQYAFTNASTEEESRAAYARYYIPGPGSIIWSEVLANVTPGHQDTYVNFRNDDRAPLLLITGSEDHIFPPSVAKSILKHYRDSKSLTELKEFTGRSHFICGQKGWEEVADYAIEWAEANARTPVGRAT